MKLSVQALPIVVLFFCSNNVPSSMAAGEDVDGGWTDWEDASECCAGMKHIVRTCTNPAPSGNGKECSGPNMFRYTCSPSTCTEPPVDGNWTDWEDASLCCNGEKTVERHCTNPAPERGGAFCQGPPTETRSCAPNAIGCVLHVDGGWSDWKDESTCCNGVKRVSRTCSEPRPTGNGADCEGSDTAEISCAPDADTCVKDVDGGWNEGVVVEGEVCCNGVIKVNRTCTNPAPSGNGKDCEGSSIELQSCAPDQCEPDVDGGWSDWEDDSICCNGEKEISRTCNNPAPQGDGAVCEGLAKDTITCYPDADTCVSDVDGGWSDWTNATVCCNGVQDFVRTCTSPAPSGNGEYCKGEATERLSCFPDECSAGDVDGGWSEWQEEASCCNGVRILSRTCTNPTPPGSGSLCMGLARKTEACSTDECEEVEEGWLEWVDETTCCNGFKTVSRQCEPNATCTGPTTATQNCFPDTCTPLEASEKVNGWSDWVPVGFCCFGKQPYTRDCVNPELGCEGLFREERACTAGEICGAGSDRDPAISLIPNKSFSLLLVSSLVFLAV